MCLQFISSLCLILVAYIGGVYTTQYFPLSTDFQTRAELLKKRRKKRQKFAELVQGIYYLFKQLVVFH